MRHYELIKLWL